MGRHIAPLCYAASPTMLKPAAFLLLLAETAHSGPCHALLLPAGNAVQQLPSARRLRALARAAKFSFS
jgi:hypothetical protein